MFWRAERSGELRWSEGRRKAQATARRVKIILCSMAKIRIAEARHVLIIDFFAETIIDIDTINSFFEVSNEPVVWT